ncbi:YihY family inner membrane protein [bacterium]|nr:YihY family inner membrane protein [bacterium]
MPETPKKPEQHSMVQRWKAFFQEDLWHFDFSKLTRVRKSFYHALQILFLVAKGFVKYKLLLRASALTFSTLLGIVPLLALTFAVLKSLGVQRRLEPILLERVAVAVQPMVSQIISYIDQVDVKSLGVIGVIIIIFTLLTVLGNIEASFNDIWGLRYQRSFFRKFSEYLSLLFIMPFFFFMALSLTAGFKSTAVVVWMQNQPAWGPLLILFMRLLPYLALWVFFTFLFVFMPNTNVRFMPAVIAGVFTGTLWQIIQWAYLTFQVGMTNINALYGTFAQLPIMFIWIFISWVIVLFGAELSFALQNVATYRRAGASSEVNFYTRTELALAFLHDIQANFQQGQAPYSDEQLGEQHEVSVRLVRQILNDLIMAGLLMRATKGRQPAYLPARQLETLPVYEVLERLEQIGSKVHKVVEPLLRDKHVPKARRYERELLEIVVQARRKALKGKIIRRE